MGPGAVGSDGGVLVADSTAQGGARIAGLAPSFLSATVISSLGQNAVNNLFANSVIAILLDQASTTFTLPANVFRGQCTLLVKQDATGGRTLTLNAPTGGTLTWLSQWQNPIGCNTASTVEGVQLTCLDGVTWYASYVPAVVEAVAYIATAETATTSTFVDLTTVGPSITMIHGTKVAVELSYYITASVNNPDRYSWTAVNISGTNSIAASPDTGPGKQNSYDWPHHIGATILFTTLTAGSDTFKMMYSTLTTAGTITWADRALTVRRIN